MSIKPVKIPGVGMRNVKTALAAAFCALAYYFVGRSPAFACIGAIFGMGSDMEDSRKNGGNRLFGAYTLWLVPLTFIGTVILIVLCQMVWVGGVQPGGVVLCILLFNTPVESYVSYALYRILDTTIGVLVAWAVSYVFPRGWMQLWQERIEALKAR